MIRTSCGTENPERAKLRLGCGAALVRRWTSYSTELPPGAGFGLACGHTASTVFVGGASRGSARSWRDDAPAHLAEKILPPRSVLEGERKPVAVNFADAKGSTELAEEVDPGVGHGILDRVQIQSEGVRTSSSYGVDGIRLNVRHPLTAPAAPQGGDGRGSRARPGRRHWLGWLVLLVHVIQARPGGALDAVSFEGLGDLPGGPFASVAFAVSGDGSTVVGTSASMSALEEAFRWRDGTMTGLGDLPGGIARSSAFAVNADGAVVVGVAVSSLGFEGYRWQAGLMQGLGDLPGGVFGSAALGVSADGSVVVGSSSSTQAQGEEAFLWKAGVMAPLGVLPGYSASRALATSAHGFVVVGTNGFPGDQAFRWEGGLMQGLGDLPGGLFRSAANAVSPDGAVVVGVSASELGDEAFRFAEGVMEGLGDLPGGGFGSAAFAVSADGSVVVGASESPLGSEAMVWSERDGMRSLQEILENDVGLDLAGWKLQEARGISHDGRIVVGRGVNPHGDPEGWIATIPAPEPGRPLLELAALLVLTQAAQAGRSRSAGAARGCPS